MSLKTDIIASFALKAWFGDRGPHIAAHRVILRQFFGASQRVVLYANR